MLSFLLCVLNDFVVSLFYMLWCVLVFVFGMLCSSSNSLLIISFVMEWVFENGVLKIGILCFVVVFKFIWLVLM